MLNTEQILAVAIAALGFFLSRTIVRQEEYNNNLRNLIDGLNQDITNIKVNIAALEELGKQFESLNETVFEILKEIKETREEFIAIKTRCKYD